jgi:hypothetical protein
MKTIYIYILAVLIGFSSCEDFLDKTPDEQLTLEAIFTNIDNVNEWLAHGYSSIEDPVKLYQNSNIWPFMSNEGVIPDTWGDGWHRSPEFIRGQWTTQSGIADNYEDIYKKIRHLHIFLDEVKPIPSQNLTEKNVADLKNQARFLRAYYYSILVQRYGPVPLITGVLPLDITIEQLPAREPYDVIVDWISNELSELALVLPETRDGGDYGRPTKGAALAIKSRLLLYAASPQFNGNTEPSYLDLENPGGEKLFNSTYDENKWKKAADAAKEVIDLNMYSLYIEFDTSDQIDALKSYRNTFLSTESEGNTELIFVRPGGGDIAGQERHQTPRTLQGYGGHGVTQEMVDAFRMADGSNISDSPDYDETSFSSSDDTYTESGTFNMYVGREPRFYAVVMYNNRLWSNPNIKSNPNYRVDFTYNGSDGREFNHDSPATGYLLNKFINPESDPTEGSFPYRPGILYRMAEIYLNYAEALNEYDPGNTDILTYLNLIRVRGGLPELSGSFTQEEMRELIRTERQIELCFENAHRFFDIRRWKIADEVYSDNIHGMNVSGTSATIGNGSTDFYRRIRVYTVNYDKRTDLLPIPQYIIERNPQLVQNPDW